MNAQTPLLTTIKAIVKAAHQEETFSTADHFHIRIENPPYMPLVIESWAVSDPFLGETRHISIAHYREQCGDLVADPEMELMDNGYPVHIQMGATDYYRTSYRHDAQGIAYVNMRERADQMSFMRTWARNLRAQGFITAAQSSSIPR